MNKKISTFIMIGLVASALAVSGCGGGSDVVGTAAVSKAKTGEKKNAYSVQEDSYGMQDATYITSSSTGATFTLRTAIAASLTDPNFRTVYRIDITNPAAVGKGTYSLGSAVDGLTQFPGDVYLFNGRNATMLRVISGTITFDSFGPNAGDLVAGTLSVTFADQSSSSNQKPTYLFKSGFSFLLNSSEQILPLPDPVPVQAAPLYAARCAGCHALGSYDATSSGAPDISLKGGELEAVFAGGHKGNTLDSGELRLLKVLLNAN